MDGSAGIDRNLLQDLADVARLTLPPERCAELAARLARVVEAFEALRGLQLPTAAGETDRTGLPLRADAAGPVLTADELFQNAPRTAAGAFLVPRVVDA